MRALGLLDSSKTDNAEATAVGDVLNGQYVVKAVGADEHGRPQYKCATLHDNEEVLVHYVGRKNNSDNDSLAFQSRKEHGAAVEATGYDESPDVDRFKVHSGKDTLIYVVRRLDTSGPNSRTEHKRNDYQGQESDIEDPRADGEPEHRPAPPRSRILIYKRGDVRLEVDIPSYGVGLHTVFMTVFSAFWIGFICFWTVAVIGVTIATLNPVGLLMAFFSVPFWIVGFFLVRSTVRSSFTHENLIITPESFRMKRTVEFRRRHRDSVNNAARADAPLTRIDRIICKQLEGATRDLTFAATREVTDRNGYTWEYFALLEGQKEHKLYTPLSDDERDWLLSEVNGTLREIKGKSRFPLNELALARMDAK